MSENQGEPSQQPNQDYERPPQQGGQPEGGGQGEQHHQGDRPHRQGGGHGNQGGGHPMARRRLPQRKQGDYGNSPPMAGRHNMPPRFDRGGPRRDQPRGDRGGDRHDRHEQVRAPG